MQCYIYRCNLKPDMYIYLAEEDVFDNVPKEIFNSLGIVEFAMELEIKPDTKLARENTETVIGNLKEHGFHIQLAGNESVETIMARISADKNSQI
ncbi:MAG: YcgL domain-containing protein [Gammaproteobacteria bacterium]|nr:YcgL domain-containing protein [Gammaproteobacteria bacterium]